VATPRRNATHTFTMRDGSRMSSLASASSPQRIGARWRIITASEPNRRDRRRDRVGAVLAPRSMRLVGRVVVDLGRERTGADAREYGLRLPTLAKSRAARAPARAAPPATGWTGGRTDRCRGRGRGRAAGRTFEAKRSRRARALRDTTDTRSGRSRRDARRYFRDVILVERVGTRAVD